MHIFTLLVSNSTFVKTVRNGLVLNSLWVRKTPVYINGTLNVTLGLLQSKVWNDLPHIFSPKNEGILLVYKHKYDI